MEKVLSIITITKNDSEGLFRTALSLESFFQLEEVEWILIDSSTPEIQQLNQNRWASIPEAHYYVTSPEGIAAAFNEGLQHASGKWVWYLNGGDCFKSPLEASMVLKLLQFSSADVVFFKTVYSPSLFSSEFPPIWMLWPNVNLWAPHPSSITKRNVINKLSGFDTSFKYAMDYDLWVRLFYNNYIVNLISIPLVLFDESGVSSTYPKAVKKEVRIIKKNYRLSYIKKYLSKLKWIWSIQ